MVIARCISASVAVGFDLAARDVSALCVIVGSVVRTTLGTW
jgi:hypothetical protein